MKIAIMLTGLIMDKTDTLPYIKEMFDGFAERNNLEIDYYCHFWSPEGLYPYRIDYHKTRMAVPWENKGSTDLAHSIFQPVESRTNEFRNLYWNAVDYYDHTANDEWKVEGSDIVKNFIVNKELHPNFFLDNFEKSTSVFDQWWDWHTWYCRYVHLVSQAYTVYQCNEMIVNSGIDYDCILKWRYDVVADLISNNDKMMSAIQHCVDSPSFYTELAWEGLEWQQDLSYDINTASHDKLISLHDGWWLCSKDVITEQFWHVYVHDIKHPPGGQHTHFHKAIRSLEVPIYFTDRIQSNIIRFPDTLPKNYNQRPWDHYGHLYNRNFMKQKTSNAKQVLEANEKHNLYHTIGGFNF